MKKHMGIPEREERFNAVSVKDFSRTNSIWNEGHFNSVSRAGKVFDKIKRANQEYQCDADYAFSGPVMPLSYWEDYYFSQVKTEEEIIRLAEGFHDNCHSSGIELTPRQALCFTLYRIIDQTYDGLVSEMLAFLLLQASLPDLELAVSGDRYDRRYGVDFVGKRDGRVVRAFQQKPERFFTAVERYCKHGSPVWVRSSANAHYKANKAFEKDCSVPVEYISLHSDGAGSVELVNHGPFITIMAKRNTK